MNKIGGFEILRTAKNPEWINSSIEIDHLLRGYHSYKKILDIYSRLRKEVFSGEPIQGFLLI